MHFPKSCLHCDDAPCVTVCPTGASYKRAEDGIVLVDEDKCIGCGLCAWACPYGAREMDLAAGVMKKCTLCIDRIYNETIEEVDRVPSCVRTCPANARHFGDLADPASAVSIMVAERGGIDLMPEQGTRPVNKYLPPRPRKPLADSAGRCRSPRTPTGRRASSPGSTACWSGYAVTAHRSTTRCIPRLRSSSSRRCPASATGWRRCSASACSIRRRSPTKARAIVLALALISGGLLSSTLHLGNPQRAWRALSQWRSSWLSREGVMAIADLRAARLCRPSLRRWSGRHIALVGLAGTVLCARHGLLHGDDLRLAEIGAGLAHAADAALLSAVCGRRRRSCLAASLPSRPAAAGLAAALARWSSSSRPGPPRLFWRQPAARAPSRFRRRRPPPASAQSAASACSSGRIQRELSDPRDGFRVARKHAAKLARIGAGASAASCRRWSLLLLALADR